MNLLTTGKLIVEEEEKSRDGTFKSTVQNQPSCHSGAVSVTRVMRSDRQDHLVKQLIQAHQPWASTSWFQHTQLLTEVTNSKKSGLASRYKLEFFFRYFFFFSSSALRSGYIGQTEVVSLLLLFPCKELNRHCEGFWKNGSGLDASLIFL